MKQFFCLLLFFFTLYAQDQVTVARRIKILIADFVSEAESGSILNGKLVAEQFELYALRSPKLLDNVLIKKRSSVAESSGFNPADISSIIARGRKYDIEGVLTGRILKGESNLYNIQIQLIDIQKKNIPSSRRIVNFAEVQGVPPSSKGVTAAVKQLIDTLEKGVFPRVDIITPDFDVVSIISINKDNFPEIQMRVSVVNQQGEPVSLPTDLFEVRENGNMVLYDIKQLNPQRAAEAQLNILFALDRSPSMLNDEKGIKSGKPFRRAKEATISFIKKLNQNDIIKIVAFDYNVLPLGDYTRDKSSYFSALQNLETGRGTGLYNVVKYCVEDIKDQPGDKVVIFLTDGKNDVRQASPEVKAVKLEDGLKIARKNTIPVYTVGFGGVDDSVMKRIAAATHSQYFKAASSKQLNELYMKIHKIIENQYIITYKSLAEKFGKVKVSLSVKDDERNFKLDSREQ
ncbi:MAG TPA: VWA domain-containing protein, partial [Spirochaetota bacterium]|nr:VWA domain-containing protein [Spirochaetota bacterium]